MKKSRLILPMRRLLDTGAVIILFFVGPVLNIDVEHLSPAQLCFAKVGWTRPCVTSSTSNKIQLAGSTHVREGPTLFRNSRSRLRNHGIKMQSIKGADLELEEAATRYALARQEELAMQIRKDLMILDEDARKAIETEKWNALVSSIPKAESDEESEGGTPWEPDEKDLVECGLFADEVNKPASMFMRTPCNGWLCVRKDCFPQIFLFVRCRAWTDWTGMRTSS
jgi:hypothetical protein